jgi:formamidopyrimidine-DNA glycosylase
MFPSAWLRHFGAAQLEMGATHEQRHLAGRGNRYCSFHTRILGPPVIFAAVRELSTARLREASMAVCEHCGNDYDKSFQVIMSSKTHTFDSFECAIHTLAPSCAHCGVKIMGHGLEKDGTFYCCDHCAEAKGVKGLRDRI